MTGAALVAVAMVALAALAVAIKIQPVIHAGGLTSVRWEDWGELLIAFVGLLGARRSWVGRKEAKGPIA